MRCERLWALFLLALIASPIPAWGAEPPTYRSRSYRITTDLPKELAQGVGRHMDLVFAEYTRRFRGFAVRNAAAQPLYVFQREEDYLNFLGEHGVDGRGSHGMFFVSPSGSGLAAFLGDEGVERMLHTLRHEGFHQFAFSRIGPDLPVWVNEGLAEYFAAAIVVNGKLEPGQVAVDRLRRIQQAARDDQFIPMRELLGLTSDHWADRVRSGGGEMQYIQSWSIVHFLVQGNAKYAAAFGKYLQLVARGTDSDAAFLTAFGRNSYQDFETRWKQYIAALEPTPEFTAAQRLEFMAQGILWLRHQGQEVQSLDQLKQSLAHRQFTVRYSTAAGELIELAATDEENFQAPSAGDAAGKGRTKPSLEMVPSKDESLPPGLLVKGLRVPVRLTWEVDGEGKLVSRVVYE